LGLQYFQKYDEQYHTQELPSSPISTAPELVEALNNLETDNNCLQYLYERISHHKDQLSESAKTRVTNFCNWDTLISPPAKLVQAYLLRQLEDEPVVLTYDAEGGKVEK
jgi:hypothetical protein